MFIVGYYVFKTVNYGGRCVGMRWFLVLHAPLGLAAARVVQRSGFVTRRPVLAGVLVGVAAVTALTGAINPWEEGFVYALFRAIGLGSIAGLRRRPVEVRATQRRLFGRCMQHRALHHRLELAHVHGPR